MLAAAVGAAFLVRARRRSRQWEADFTAARSEVGWFAHELIPELAAAPSAAQLHGGWRVGSARIAAVEDKLTALEANASSDARRAEVRNTRDAVRAARANLDALSPIDEPTVTTERLRAAAAELEQTLGSVHVAPRTPDPA